MCNNGLKWIACFALVPVLIAGGVAQADEAKDSIVGRVLLKTDPPSAPPVRPTSDPFCMKVHEQEPIKNEAVVVGDDKELKNVFVHVKSGLPDRKWPVPEEPVVLDQKGCRYIPHVFGVMVGQKLEIRNSDNTNHNVHGLPKENEEFNFGQPRPGMKTLLELLKPETFKIKCDVHAWMETYCHVMEHPFFATTDKDGKFAIKGLPAGEYEIEFWHESGTTQTQKVKVEEGKATDLKDVDFEIETRRRRPRR